MGHDWCMIGVDTSRLLLTRSLLPIVSTPITPIAPSVVLPTMDARTDARRKESCKRASCCHTLGFLCWSRCLLRGWLHGGWCSGLQFFHSNARVSLLENNLAPALYKQVLQPCPFLALREAKRGAGVVRVQGHTHTRKLFSKKRQELKIQSDGLLSAAFKGRSNITYCQFDACIVLLFESQPGPDGKAREGHGEKLHVNHDGGGRGICRGPVPCAISRILEWPILQTARLLPLLLLLLLPPPVSSKEHYFTSVRTVGDFWVRIRNVATL